MNEDLLKEFERDCIRKAAGQPDAEIHLGEGPGGRRSRAYHLHGSKGRSFVKCLDSGYRNPSGFYLTLDHEAEGYRFFGGLADDKIAMPEVHFFESFCGPAGQELQVLGMTDLRAVGATRSAADVYSDRSSAPGCQEGIAGLCGCTMARLVSTEFQSELDRAAGAAAIRRQTDRLLNHPDREVVLDLIANHVAIPWAYQNRVMGEMNVLLPRWLEAARGQTRSETRAKLERVGRALTDPDVIQALSPAQSLDRVIFSPRDRHDGNTLLTIQGGEVLRAYEIDVEFWGLETGGRLIGRYLATMESSGRSRWPGDGDLLRERLSHLMGTFLFHFVRGNGEDSPDVVLRAVHVGLAAVHAAMLWLYMAAIFPSSVSARVGDAFHCLGQPGRYLHLTAEYARSQPRAEAELVEGTVEQVVKAMQPIYELVTGLL
jgi:hypothetical protein